MSFNYEDANDDDGNLLSWILLRVCQNKMAEYICMPHFFIYLPQCIGSS